ncbi:MAG: hypothetical protein IPN78_06835 [Candidatus Accumulibacter sp.]|nr:hypothetical protein [Candidatus Accumulibacter propinquus]
MAEVLSGLDLPAEPRLLQIEVDDADKLFPPVQTDLSSVSRRSCSSSALASRTALQKRVAQRLLLMIGGTSAMTRADLVSAYRRQNAQAILSIRGTANALACRQLAQRC